MLGPWLSAFFVTQTIEMPIYVAVLGGKQRIAKAFGASAITHPVVWFVIPAIWPWGTFGYVGYAIAAEAFAVVVEAIYLRAFGLRRALLWSLVANGASLGSGLILRALIGWP